MYHINKRVYIHKYMYMYMYMYMYKRMLNLKPENVKEDQHMYQKKCIYIYATLHEHSTGKSSTGNTYISTSLLLLISLSFSFSSSSFGNGRKCLCWYFN